MYAYVCICVAVYTYVCKYSYTCVCLCLLMYMWRPEINVWCLFSNALSFLVFETGYHYVAQAGLELTM